MSKDYLCRLLYDHLRNYNINIVSNIFDFHERSIEHFRLYLWAFREFGRVDITSLQPEADAVEEHAAFLVGAAVSEADDVFDGDDSDSVFVA